MTRISELPNATMPLAGDEAVPIVQGGETVKAPVSALGSAGGLSKSTYQDLARGGFLGNPFACLSYLPGLGGYGQLDFVGANLANLAGVGFVRAENFNTSGSAADQNQQVLLSTGANSSGRMHVGLETPAQTFDIGYEFIRTLEAVRGDIEHIEARWHGYVLEPSDATNRFEVRLTLAAGVTPVGLRYSDNINGGNWQLYQGLSVLADLNLGLDASDNGWFRLRVTPDATTGASARVQLWLDNWNTGEADVLFDGSASLPGLDVTADERIKWTPEVGILKSTGTTPRQFDLAALQVHLQAR